MSSLFYVKETFINSTLDIGYKDPKKNKIPHTYDKFTTQEDQNDGLVPEEESSKNAIDFIKCSFRELHKIIESPIYQKKDLLLTLNLIQGRLETIPKNKMFSLFSNNFFQELIRHCLDKDRVDEGKALCILLKEICDVFSNHHLPFSEGSLRKIIEFVTLIDPCSVTSLNLLMLISKKYPNRCIQFEHIFYQNFRNETIEIISKFIYYVIRFAIMIPDFNFSPMMEIMFRILGRPNIDAKMTVYATIKVVLIQKVPFFIENFKNEFCLKHFCDMRRSQLNCITILGWELTGLMIEFIDDQIITSIEYLDFPLMNDFLCRDNKNSYKVQNAIFKFLGNALKKCPSMIDIILENEKNPDSCILTPLLNCIHCSIYQVRISALSVLLDILMSASTFQLRMIVPDNVIEALFNHILTVDDTTELTVVQCLIKVVDAYKSSELGYKMVEIFDTLGAQEYLEPLLDSEVVANDAEILFGLVYKNG